jgi:hypothetical protein
MQRTASCQVQRLTSRWSGRANNRAPLTSGRCYDFQCQEWAATFLRLHDVV